MKVLLVAIILGCAGLCAGCSPKVGSEAWCKVMDKKPKGEWTANEASEYAKSCIFK